LSSEYADHASRSTQPDNSDADDDVAESDAGSASQSEDNEASDNTESSDLEESGDEGVVSVRKSQQHVVNDSNSESERRCTSSSSPLDHSSQLQADIAPLAPIVLSENFIEVRPSIEKSIDHRPMPPIRENGSKEPVQVSSEGRPMRIRKARVLTSSCDCGCDVENIDRHEGSQVAVRCAAKGCETVWVCCSFDLQAVR